MHGARTCENARRGGALAWIFQGALLALGCAPAATSTEPAPSRARVVDAGALARPDVETAVTVASDAGAILSDGAAADAPISESRDAAPPRVVVRIEHGKPARGTLIFRVDERRNATFQGLHETTARPVLGVDVATLAELRRTLASAGLCRLPARAEGLHDRTRVFVAFDDLTCNVELRDLDWPKRAKVAWRALDELERAGCGGPCRSAGDGL